jgi:hypothetical protein
VSTDNIERARESLHRFSVDTTIGDFTRAALLYAALCNVLDELENMRVALDLAFLVELDADGKYRARRRDAR